MKRYYLSLFGGSKKSTINKLIKDLEAYRDSLSDKTEIFISRLADIGVKATSVRVGSISPFYRGDIDVSMGELRNEGDNWVCEIKMAGEQSIFIEFGSGVTFNTDIGGSKHPKGAELGYTIGSYNPSSPNAANPYGWWYVDKYGQKQHTYGTPTFAPMYHGSLEMISAIEGLAKEVFKK